MKRFAAIAVVAAFAVGSATAQQAAGGKRHAVLVGIGEYDHPNLKPLAYAEKDAVDLGDVLRNKGYLVEVLSAKTGSQDPAHKPTLANIRARLAARQPIGDLVPAAVERHIVEHHLYGAVGDLHGQDSAIEK